MDADPQPTPHVVKIPSPVSALQSAASDLTTLEKGSDGLIFTPIEAIADGQRLGNALFVFLKNLALLAIRGMIAPCEVLLRYDFGERYFNAWVGFSCIGLAIAVFMRGRSEESVVAAGLLAIFFIGERIHALVCFMRDRRGDYWHSYSEGTSRFRVKAVDAFLSKWHFTFDFSTLIVEPAVLLAASLGIRPLGLASRSLTFTSSYLFYASVALFFYQLYCWNERRRVLLDEKDARVIMEAKQHASKPNQPLGLHSYLGVAYTPSAPKTEWKK